MQVKGHIAKMAVCLEDHDTRISALARLFFHELAKKEYKVIGTLLCYHANSSEQGHGALGVRGARKGAKNLG